MSSRRPCSVPAQSISPWRRPIAARVILLGRLQACLKGTGNTSSAPRVVAQAAASGLGTQRERRSQLTELPGGARIPACLEVPSVPAIPRPEGYPGAGSCAALRLGLLS